MTTKNPMISVVGAGLAGSEAAWQCLKAGFQVRLYEMRPDIMTEAHQTARPAELVCSNSFKSLSEDSPSGLLKEELACFDSLILAAAKRFALPAGQALAVDRAKFSEQVQSTLLAQERLEYIPTQIESLPSQDELAADSTAWIVATGPLSSPAMTECLQQLCSDKQQLYFYDSIAPVIETDSIDLEHCFYGSRYDDDCKDYLNIPLNKEEYEEFITAVEQAEKMPLHPFEKPQYFESCLPIEVMIERGRETLRFGPMKPVGLTNPKTGRWPWANIQLRLENKSGTMMSMVGFQTKMKWPEQARVFGTLNALKNAEFFRFGSIHRNTYVDSPRALNSDLSFKSNDRIFLAGQITGVEGYLESTAMGLLAAQAAIHKLNGKDFPMPPKSTVIGALADYVTVGPAGPFQPMNTNMGLLPPIAKQRGVSKKERRHNQCVAARHVFLQYHQDHFPPN